MARGAVAAAGAAAAGGVGGLLGPSSPAFGFTNGPGRNGISNAKPKRGGSLVFASDSESQGFNPTTAEWDETGYSYGRTVFDPLLNVGSRGQLVPYLASSVVPNTTHTSFTITLRPGITFHDGSPLNAQAVVINLQKQSTSLLLGEVFHQFVKDFTATGPLTVRIDLNEPNVTFPYYLSGASQVGYVAAPSMLESANGGTDNPIGTGPFIFESWVQNDHFTAKRNPKYWRPGYPYLDSITFKPIADSNARSQALQAKNIDIMVCNTPQVMVEYRGNRAYSYTDDSSFVVGEPSVNMLQLNCGSPPFDDLLARRAAAFATPQDEVVRIIGLNIGGPVNSPFVTGTPYYSKTSYPSYDLSTAKKLVEGYRKKTGDTLTFTISATTDPEVLRTVELLQQVYGEAGMKVSISTMEQNTLVANAVEGKYQAATWRQFGTVIPDLNYVFWSSETVNKAGSISLNIARNYDPRIQSAMVTARQTTNASVRAKAFQNVGQYLAEDLPYLWLGRSVWAVISSPQVQDFNKFIAPNGTSLIDASGGSLWPVSLWLS